jgi:hypothetical protein
MIYSTAKFLMSSWFAEKLVSLIIDKISSKEETYYQTDRPLYVALTLSPDRYEGLEKKLYVSGLALLYSSSRFSS